MKLSNHSAPKHLYEEFVTWLDTCYSDEPTKPETLDITLIEPLLDSLADCCDPLEDVYSDFLGLRRGANLAEAVHQIRQWAMTYQYQTGADSREEMKKEIEKVVGLVGTLEDNKVVFYSPTGFPMLSLAILDGGRCALDAIPILQDQFVQKAGWKAVGGGGKT